MKLQRQTLEEKTDLVQKVNELSRNENISIKETCKRLDTPYFKYFNAMKAIKNEKRKIKAEKKLLSIASKPSDVGELRVELVFKGEAAKLVRESADAYGVEPEAVCRILLIDALKENKK
jgi:hypothetical protein